MSEVARVDEVDERVVQRQRGLPALCQDGVDGARPKQSARSEGDGAHSPLSAQPGLDASAELGNGGCRSKRLSGGMQHHVTGSPASP